MKTQGFFENIDPDIRKFGFLCFLLCAGLLSLFFGTLVYAKISSTAARKSIPLMIADDPAVLKVEILDNDGIIHSEFYIRILFKDGGKLELSRVNEWGRGKIKVERVGDYRIVGVKDGVGISREQQTKLLSYITGLQLKSVMDFVKNYRVIFNLVENLPERKNQRDSNQIIIYEDQEYFLAKDVVRSGN
jgi:hypothetical protein